MSSCLPSLVCSAHCNPSPPDGFFPDSCMGKRNSNLLFPGPWHGFPWLSIHLSSTLLIHLIPGHFFWSFGPKKKKKKRQLHFVFLDGFLREGICRALSEWSDAQQHPGLEQFVSASSGDHTWAGGVSNIAWRIPGTTENNNHKILTELLKVFPENLWGF